MAETIEEIKRLIVIAHPMEAFAFGELHKGDELITTGVGKINATLNLALELIQNPYEEVIVLGTAGCINPSLTVGEIYEPTSFIQHDFSLQSAVLKNSHSNHVESFVIATGDSFINSINRKQYLNSLNVDMVDMESYAYYDVCQRLGVPCRVFKLLSDHADGNADALWDEEVKKYSAQLEYFYQTTLNR